MAVAFALAVDGSDFSDWATGYPDVERVTELAYDSDGDGIPNGIEAWFGTHPGQSNPGIENIATNGTVISLTHPVSSSMPDDLQGSYQWSTNLNDWYECDGIDGPATGETLTTSSQIEQNTATVTFNASGTMERIFLRPAVTQP